MRLWLRTAPAQQRKRSPHWLSRHAVVKGPRTAALVTALRQACGHVGRSLHHGRTDWRAAAVSGRKRNRPALPHPAHARAPHSGAEGGLSEEPALPGHEVPRDHQARNDRKTLTGEAQQKGHEFYENLPKNGPQRAHDRGRRASTHLIWGPARGGRSCRRVYRRQPQQAGRTGGQDAADTELRLQAGPATRVRAVITATMWSLKVDI